jgi:hypothetical protein
MSGSVMLDIHLRYLIQYSIDSIISAPDERIAEIFGDARLDPHAALFGDDLLDSIKNFFLTTKIPVVLGYEIDPSQIPGVTINLERSSPSQRYLGDTGRVMGTAIRQDNRPVVVPMFSPLLITPGDGYLVIKPPLDVDDSLISPGLSWRDALGQEFAIGSMPDGSYTLTELSVPVSQANTSQLEVISPFSDRQFREGAMLFDEVALVTVHGHANRTEGLWLWMAVQHGLLKYRPLLDSMFGLQLAEPMSSDFAKDDSFLGEHVWRRFITVSAKSMWTWEGPGMIDVLSFIASIKAINSSLITPVSLPLPTP